MKKGLRKQVVELLLAHYSEELSSMMSGFTGYPDEVECFICECLDDTCSNGHFSRWTAFGNSLYVECMEFKKEYSSAFDKCNVLSA